MINGIAEDRHRADPYKKTALTPNLGGVDETDDIRGGMGFEGLQELAQVRAGGRHADHRRLDRVADGGVSISRAASRWSIRRNLFARGSILRGVFADLKSPIAYGYDGKDLPVYFNQDPVLNAAAAAGWAASAAAVRGALRRRPERHAECRADSDLAARTRRCGGGSRDRRAAAAADAVAAVARRRHGGGGGGVDEAAVAGSRPPARSATARGGAVPRQRRTTCCFRARWPAARRSPIARWRSTCRWARATS